MAEVLEPMQGSEPTEGDRWWASNAAYGAMRRAEDENARLERTRQAVAAAGEFIRRKEVERMVRSGAPLEVAEFRTRAASTRAPAAPAQPPQLMTIGGPQPPGPPPRLNMIYRGEPEGELPALAQAKEYQAIALEAQRAVEAEKNKKAGPGITGLWNGKTFKPNPVAQPAAEPMTMDGVRGWKDGKGNFHPFPQPKSGETSTKSTVTTYPEVKEQIGKTNWFQSTPSIPASPKRVETETTRTPVSQDASVAQPAAAIAGKIVVQGGNRFSVDANGNATYLGPAK